MQEETGLQSATDGEFRRTEWHTDFIKRLGGIREADTATTSPPSAGLTPQTPPSLPAPRPC